MATTSSGNSKSSELGKRALFTLSMLAIYRLCIYIAIPGVNSSVMSRLIESGKSTSFLGMLNLFSGGAIEQLSVFALGVMPYISASIVIQLLTMVVPFFDQLQKEGEQGRKKLNQYTRYGAVLIAIVQAFFVVTNLQSGPFNEMLSRMHLNAVVLNPGWSFTVMAVWSMLVGTLLLMWVGEVITERGIGNGTSLLIFSGIVSKFPSAIYRLFEKVGSTGTNNLSFMELLLIGGIVFVVVAFVIYCERGQRKILVQYAKRIVGQKEYGAQSVYLPLKINMSGVIPPLFASAILMLPSYLAKFFNSSWAESFADSWQYYVIYVPLIIFFSYFYTAVTFNPLDIAENMRKNGGFIPGIRPGKKTAEYIDGIISRLTFGGALYISLICVLPAFLHSKFNVPFSFGGTSLLIVVGVALDLMQQLQQYTIDQNYVQMMAPKGGKIRARSAG